MLSSQSFSSVVAAAAAVAIGGGVDALFRADILTNVMRNFLMRIHNFDGHFLLRDVHSEREK